ncbi:MAG: RHS repeat-associated core domain-containing protein [Chryseolinea sp.]
MDVYFDELNIVYKESPVIQINAYYPFGLMAFNWTRIGEEKIKETFQGKELDEKTGWHDFQMRKYVGAIGRFLSQDPRNQFGSGYTSLGNNPVMGIDPDGEWVHLAVGAVIGGVVNWAMELSLIHKV